MHLPPLDVAVYPVVMGGHSRPSGRTVQPTSAIPVPSPALLNYSGSYASHPDFLSIDKLICNVFRSSTRTVRQAERLQSHLHQVYLTRMTDNTCLVLKCPPTRHTRLLRHEKNSLETERKVLETLYEYARLPVFAHVMKYDSKGGPNKSAFLLMSHLPGRPLSDLSAYLSVAEKRAIDRKLGEYVSQLTKLSATQFGSTNRVFSKKGYNTWRDAFVSLLEAVLRDGEDMLVTLPYEHIRSYIAQHAHHLAEVPQPRLVALNVCEPENVLLDPHTKEITGLVGFSNVLWGDPLMSGGIDLDNGSDAFFEGYGGRPSRTRGVIVRCLM